MTAPRSVPHTRWPDIKRQRALKGSDGTRWALFRRHDIRDIADPDAVYLRRWRLIQTPWFGIFLHKILLPDSDRHLHDHPWPFVSVVLKGGYEELLFKDGVTADRLGSLPNVKFLGRRTQRWRRGSVHFMPTKQFHAIKRLMRVPTWTLIFIGPRQRVWGYATENGWVDHETYHRERRWEW